MGAPADDADIPHFTSVECAQEALESLAEANQDARRDRDAQTAYYLVRAMVWSLLAIARAIEEK